MKLLPVKIDLYFGKGVPFTDMQYCTSCTLLEVLLSPGKPLSKLLQKDYYALTFIHSFCLLTLLMVYLCRNPGRL